MLVTEGDKSATDRVVCIFLIVGLLAGSTFLFVLLPRLIPPVLCAASILGGCLFVRFSVLSLLARFFPAAIPERITRYPSLAFLVPCLNELSALKITIPAMLCLKYPGKIACYYICESSSRDCSMEYIRTISEKENTVFLLDKPSAPTGRGAAISYGLSLLPPADVVGFLDADHVIDEQSLRVLAQVFSQTPPPVAVQGTCLALNESQNLLTQLLSVERRWLEVVELGVNPRFGGISFYGGGQGFFTGSLFKDSRFAIDDSMVLDDIDLSYRLFSKGIRVEFQPQIATRSFQPKRFSQFIDQRLRWARGWLQVSHKYLAQALSTRGEPLKKRWALLSFLIIPYVAAYLFFAFGACSALLILGEVPHMPLWVILPTLLWPLLLGLLPFVSGVTKTRTKHILLIVPGIALLALAHCSFFAVSILDKYILRRQPRYSKTSKTVS